MAKTCILMAMHYDGSRNKIKHLFTYIHIIFHDNNVFCKHCPAKHVSKLSLFQRLIRLVHIWSSSKTGDGKNAQLKIACFKISSARLTSVGLHVHMFGRDFPSTRHLVVLQLLINPGLKAAAFRLIRQNPGNNSTKCNSCVSVLKAIKSKYSHYWDYQEVCQRAGKL